MVKHSIQEKLATQDIPALPLVFSVPTIEAMTIHSRIRDLRIQKELSMEALAERVGVSWQTVQQWERDGGTAPKRTRLQKVAEELGTTPEYLMSGADPVVFEWPFKKIRPEKIAALSHDDLVRLEAAIIFAAGQVGVDIMERADKARTKAA